VGGNVDGTGTEEQGDFGEAVVDNVDQSALDTWCGKQCHTHNNIGELADCRIRQPRFQIILGKGDDGSDDHGEADKIGGGDAEIQGMHGIGTEHVQHDPGCAEHSDLDDGNRMKQRGNRCRCNHRPGQPMMKWHDPVFGKTEDAEDVQHDDQRLVHIGGEDTRGDVCGEIERSGQDIDENHGRQEKGLGGRGEIDQIFASAVVSFLVLMVGNQRIGADRDDFIKQVHGKEVVGEGNPYGAKDGQGETGVKASLGMFVQPPHVPH